MPIQKTCSKCASVLPEKSISELCDACTKNANESNTQVRSNDERSSSEELHHNTVLWEQEFEENYDSLDARLTHIAAAAQFLTAKATDPSSIPPSTDVFPKIANYEIRKEIGRGGGGVVYEARQIRADRLVAIKILLGRLPAERERFIRETLSLGRIKHPSVVQVYEVGDCEMGPYFTMELMTGGSLSQKLKSHGKLPAKEAAQLLETVAQGMSAVHQAGILHRDLKPANILLDKNGTPKIADFGLAKTWQAEVETKTVEDLTATNAYLGTPAYMAPEQAECRHDDIDVRTDVYGLGGILYQSITGQAPYQGRNPLAVARKITSEQLAEPRSVDRSIPPELEAICLKCLEKNPADRYIDASQLASDLAAWQRGENTVARPLSFGRKTTRWLRKQRRHAVTVSLLLAVAAVINVAAMLITRDDPDAELKKIRKEIQTGELVTLIGPTGRPRWYSKETGPLEFSISDFGGDVCCVESKDVKFLELLPEADVPPAFVLKAEVRHERGENWCAETGIYIGRWRNRNADGSEEMYSTRVWFDDAFHAGNAIGDNHAFFAPTRDLYFPDNLGTTYHVNMSLKPITSKLTTKWTWRTLTMVVRKTQTMEHALTPDDSPFDRPTTNISDITDLLQRSFAASHPNLPVPARVLENPIKGGLGLHNSFGKSSFRNVTIQKLPD